MRLPTLTARQEKYEDARQMHETLYEFYLRGERLALAYLPEDAPEQSLRRVGALHGFWQRRGYIVHLKQQPNRQGYWLWLEPKAEGTKTRSAA